MIVSCDCGAKLKVDDAKIRAGGVKVRCPRCGEVHLLQKPESAGAAASPAWGGAPSADSAGPLVLIAHDSSVVAEMIASVLYDGGFRSAYAPDGLEALKKASELRPPAMILDVGLKGIYGFELCERLKGEPETASIKVVLLSSVYDMTRYKRAPVSLYGADDYIEKHHIPNSLIPKLKALLGLEAPAPQPEERVEEPQQAGPRMFDPAVLGHMGEEADGAFPRYPAPAGHSHEDPSPSRISFGTGAAQPSPAQHSALVPEAISLDSSIFQQEEFDIPRVDEADPGAIEKARRFARIIVSDIALYNQEAVVDGLKNGTFYELLKDDVSEGRALYENRVPPSIRRGKDYYQEAFDNFIASRKNVR